MNSAFFRPRPIPGERDARPRLLMRLSLAMALLPGVAAAQTVPSAAAASPGPARPPTVMACGLAFELPVEYRVTRPRRTEGPGGMRLCSFNVVSAANPPKELKCMDKEEGGSPPYNVCDWALSGAGDWPTVQVARTRMDTDHQSIDPFQFEESGWQLPNAYRGAEALKRTRFFGKRAYLGEAVTRGSWYRTRVKKYESMQAGARSVDAVLMQLTPQLAVVLVGPPLDRSADGVTECRVFCGSLRAAGRPGDEP